MKDNLFDKEFTILDAVKILLLIVTAFSTWNVVEIMTPDTPFAFVRKIAALGVVEGAFIGFEMATAKAKSRRQTKFATIGFFCSLAVIAAFAGTSGLLEFGGDAILGQNMGVWLGITWLAGDVVMVGTLIVLVTWIVVLASLYRMYALNDPDKRAELDRIEMDEEVTEESNRATRIALKKAQPQIASARARAHVEKKYSPEIGLDGMNTLLDRVTQRLNEEYAVSPSIHDVAVDPERGFVPRVPPMEQNIPVVSPVELKDPKTIYLFAGVTTNGLGEQVTEGDQLTAKLADDGRYDVSRFGTGRTFTRLTLDELHWLAGDVDDEGLKAKSAEVKPVTGGDFRNPQ